MKLDKLLQSQGFGSRQYCQTLVQQGAVQLNGVMCHDYRMQISQQQLNHLIINIFGQDYLYRQHVYIALYKPLGYECSHQSSYHHSIYTLLPEYLRLRQVQSVGRLDQDTTGLILLTDDGKFIQKMTHPKHHVSKSYHVTTCHDFDDHFLNCLAEGVYLKQESRLFKADHLQAIAHNQLVMTIHQGVYHQVKRMIASAGNRVAALHRFQIGHLHLDSLNLEIGQWCFLNQEQLQVAQSTVT